MGAHGGGPARLPGGLAVHLAANPQRERRLRDALPRDTRTGTPRDCGCCGSPRGCAASTAGTRSSRCTRRSAHACSTLRATACSAADLGTPRLLEPLLRDAGLPAELADALDDTALDDEIRAETEEALALTGRDVGTPILHFQPPGGTAFFGPVISRLPSPADAGRAVGPRHRAGGVPRLRRAQAQPARAASAGQLRRRHRIGWQARGLARRQPSSQEVVCGSAAAANQWT